MGYKCCGNSTKARIRTMHGCPEIARNSPTAFQVCEASWNVVAGGSVRKLVENVSLGGLALEGSINKIWFMGLAQGS